MKAQGITVATQGPKGVGWAFGASLAVHGLALAAIVWGWGTSSVPVGVPTMDVELVVAAPGESASASGDPASAPTATASTQGEPASVSGPAPTTTIPAAPASASEARQAVPPAATLVPPPVPPDWRETHAPPDKSSPPTSITIVPPAPEPLAAVPSESNPPGSTPAPTPEVSPAEPPIPPAALQPKTAAPSRPPAAPPRAASPPRPAPPPAPKRSQPDAASTPVPTAPAPQAGGAAQGPELSSGGAASGGARLVRHISPIYPALARERGLEGRVVVRLMIGANGVPSEVRVAQSSGFESLDAAAIEAVRQWRFEPARRAGVAVPEERLAPVVFRLRR